MTRFDDITTDVDSGLKYVINREYWKVLSRGIIST